MTKLASAVWRYVARDGRLELFNLLVCAAASIGTVRHFAYEFRAVAAVCGDAAAADGGPLAPAGPAPREPLTSSPPGGGDGDPGWALPQHP
jgi:hypothetical protein